MLTLGTGSSCCPVLVSIKLGQRHDPLEHAASAVYRLICGAGSESGEERVGGRWAETRETAAVPLPFG